jgi:hypothetical protein
MEVGALVAELERVDVGGCDAAAVERAVGLVRQVRGWLDAMTMALSERADSLRSVGAGREPEVVLTRVGGYSRREAREVDRQAATVRRMPALAPDLLMGLVSAAHVSVISRATANHPHLAARSDQLIEMARRLSPDDLARHLHRLGQLTSGDGGVGLFERQRRQTRLRRWIDADGMHHVVGVFDPESGALLFGALERQVEMLFHDARPDTAPDDPAEVQDHLAGLALVALARGNRGTGGGPVSTELNVHIDFPSLRDGLHERSRIEPNLPVEAVRRLACEAGIIPIVLSGDGVVLDVGRSRRLATADQRRALRAMYPTCAGEDCSVPFDRCHVHHLDPWREGGRTDLTLLVPTCNRHHHLVHEGRWIAVRDAAGLVTLRPPPAGHHAHDPPRPAA